MACSISAAAHSNIFVVQKWQLLLDESWNAMVDYMGRIKKREAASAKLFYFFLAVECAHHCDSTLPYVSGASTYQPRSQGENSYSSENSPLLLQSFSSKNLMGKSRIWVPFIPGAKFYASLQTETAQTIHIRTNHEVFTCRLEAIVTAR